MRARVWMLAVVLVAGGVGCATGVGSRSDGAAGRSKSKLTPIEVKVVRLVPMTSQREASSVVGYLVKGQSVKVLEVGDKSHYVAAYSERGTLYGWVVAEALEAGLMEAVRKQEEQAVARRLMIEKHEVEVGMTRAEVLESLGKPARKSRQQTVAGEEERWAYVTYQYLPSYRPTTRSDGKVQHSASYQRQPNGHKIIVFQGEEVVAVEVELARNIGH